MHPSISGTAACTTDDKFEHILREKACGEFYQCTTKWGTLDLADKIDVRIQEAPFGIPPGYQQYWFQAQHLGTFENHDYVATILDTGA